jgi:hypothetical protein
MYMDALIDILGHMSIVTQQLRYMITKIGLSMCSTYIGDGLYKKHITCKRNIKRRF